jgi:hypothetical protein
MQPRSWLYSTAAVALSFLLVGTLWVIPYLPTNDGPAWIFATHAENHYSDPGAPYSAWFLPAPALASRGLTLFYGPFEAWLGWDRGLRVALSLIALLSAWGFFTLARTLHPERRAVGLLGFPLSLSWSFYMGFWSFAIATGLGLFILALAVHVPRPRWRQRAVLSALLFAQAVAHVFGAVLTGGALLALGLARAPRGQRRAELGRLALTGLPALGILAACVALSRNLAAAPMAQGAARLPWRNAALALPRTIAPGPLHRALLVTLAVLAAALLAAIRARREATEAADRGLGVAAIVLLLCGLFAPFQITGWEAFSERFVPLGVALAFAVLPLECAAPAVRRWSAPGLLTLAAVWLCMTYPFHRRLTTLCPDAIAGLFARVPMRGTVLPVILGATELPFYDRTNAEVPLLDPLIHMGCLYAAAHGGLPLGTFAGSPAVHPFIDRPGAKRPPEPDFAHYYEAINSHAFHHESVFRRKVEDELAAFGVFYDTVVVVGARPEDLLLWRGRGYVADWSAETALVAHFEPCTVDFTVPRASADPPPTFDLNVGDIGLWSDAHAAPMIMDDGLAHFMLTPSPCGNIAVRAHWDGPQGATFCDNASRRGDIVTSVTRSANVIACERH